MYDDEDILDHVIQLGRRDAEPTRGAPHELEVAAVQLQAAGGMNAAFIASRLADAVRALRDFTEMDSPAERDARPVE